MMKPINTPTLKEHTKYMQSSSIIIACNENLIRL